MSATETDLHVLQTREFIQVDPVNLVLRRSAKQADGAGGWIQLPEQNLHPQVVRVLGTPTPLVTVIPDGRQRLVDVSVVGFPNFDVLEGDTFDWLGDEYEITFISHSPRWRVTAGARRRG